MLRPCSVRPKLCKPRVVLCCNRHFATFNGFFCILKRAITWRNMAIRRKCPIQCSPRFGLTSRSYTSNHLLIAPINTYEAACLFLFFQSRIYIWNSNTKRASLDLLKVISICLVKLHIIALVVNSDSHSIRNVLCWSWLVGRLGELVAAIYKAALEIHKIRDRITI